MRVFGAASFALVLTVPLAIGARPAAAQDQGNGFMGQVQRFFDNGQNGQNSYQRGLEQGRQQQAHRDWRARRERPYAENRTWRDNGPRYPDNRYGYGNGYADQSAPPGNHGYAR